MLTFHAFEVEGVEQVGNDSVIDIDVLPNRSSDCLSHRRIAKEISTILGTPLKKDTLSENRILEPKTSSLEVVVEDDKLCRRFSAAVVEGVSVGPTPDWLRERLSVIGQKSINNIVDATNYVMFDLGQPLHAFDRDKLVQKDGRYTITVRNAKKDEKMTVLTGEEYTLSPNNLLITDGQSGKPIGIAGVKGGKVAEIDSSTKNLIIECANFNPTSVRKTSQFLKLRTDASTRFENEPPVQLTQYALSEVVELILDIAGGKLVGYVDFFPRKPEPYRVGVSVAEVNKLLGSHIEEKDVENIFDRFGFEYKKVRPIDTVLKLAPQLVGRSYKYGASITYDAPNTFDCSSFTSYVFIQGGISLPRIVIDQFVYGQGVGGEGIQPGDLVFSVSDEDLRKKHSFIRLSDGKKIDHIGPKEVSEEFLPGTKIAGGISHNGIYLGSGKVIHAGSSNGVVIEDIKESKYFKNIVGYRRMTDNDARYMVTVPFERLDLRIKEDLIEEIGRIYGYENIGSDTPKKLVGGVIINKRFYYAEKIRNLLEKEGFSEVYTYTFRDSGEIELENSLASDKNWLRSNLREEIDASLALNAHNADLLGLSTIKIFEFGTVFKKEGEYNSFAFGVRNTKKGSPSTISERSETEGGRKKEDDIVKSVTASISNELGVEIKGEIKDGIFEINFDEVLEKLSQPKKYEPIEKESKKIVYKPISSYPFALRDIAVWVPKDVQESEVLEILKKEAGDLLVRTTLFDTYEKDGKVSYAFRLVFQSNKKTLTDDEVNKIIENITKKLESKADWEVR